jgi:hypothetical protein
MKTGFRFSFSTRKISYSCSGDGPATAGLNPTQTKRKKNVGETGALWEKFFKKFSICIF